MQNVARREHGKRVSKLWRKEALAGDLWNVQFY
jgi:hypothetical protein